MSTTGELECQMCFDTVPMSESLSLCAHDHRFCGDCCWRCCESALGDGLVPACPNEKQTRCGTVDRAVAGAALTRWLCAPAHDEARRRLEALSGWDIRGSASRGFLSGKLDDVYASADRARRGAVQCIGRGCGAFYVPPIPHAPGPQRLQCTVAGCGAVFCSACRQPFHHRSSCAEALRLSAKWIKFLQDELMPFLIAAVRVDGDRWAPILKKHSQSKGALDAAARDALSRFDELRRMELWKEKHCKRCPCCKRVVEKMDGCDMMMCGTDAHGGNQQRGCGKPFVWCEGQPNSALPYEADLRGAAEYAAEEGGGAGEGGEEDNELRERRLRRDAREEHQSRPGVPVRCDVCAAPIVGPRLQCVQCDEGVDLCVCCVSKAARKSVTLRSGRRHPKNHVFRRIRQTAMAHQGPSSVALASSTEGFVELKARDVDMRPGLSTARAAAASAAEARASAARAAAAAAATESRAAAEAVGRGGAAEPRERGSRKRAAHPTAGSSAWPADAIVIDLD